MPKHKSQKPSKESGSFARDTLKVNKNPIRRKSGAKPCFANSLRFEGKFHFVIRYDIFYNDIDETNPSYTGFVIDLILRRKLPCMYRWSLRSN